MTYYAFFLTAAESEDGNKKGYGYAIQNKDRWIEASVLGTEINTYDRSTTHVVYEGAAYHIFRDFIDIDNNYRVFVFQQKGLTSDDASKTFS